MSESSVTHLNVPPPPDTQLFAEDGTDLSLIRWMLSLTPEQRLRTLQNYANSVMRLRRATRQP